MPVASFPKTARILKANEFSSVVRLHPWVHSVHWVLYSRYTGQPARLGLIIGRKHARRAVTRNIIKRIGRELFRTQRAELYGWDMLLRLQRQFDQHILLSASSSALKIVCRDEIQTLFASAMQRASAVCC